jgi:hypothetical protein
VPRDFAYGVSRAYGKDEAPAIWSQRVPVTAKLSKHFYDTFGDDIANELVDWFNQVDATYRGELRELNEVNFARFDAKLEQRITEVKAELRHEVGDLRSEVATLRVELRADLQAGLANLRSELLKWMFLFWVTTIGGLVALAR